MLKLKYLLLFINLFYYYLPIQQKKASNIQVPFQYMGLFLIIVMRYMFYIGLID